MNAHARPGSARSGLGPTGLVAVTMVAAVVGGIASPAQAATVTVSGWVYRDLDDDGVRDAAEPGVAGIRVHRNSGNGTPTATTDADGHWTLAGITPGAAGVIQVETGWFRSQCSALKCAAGPGPDNDFLTNNQFIQLPLSSLAGAATDLDVGLLPDWPGNASVAPAPQSGAVPANSVDVAARLSWTSSTCSDGKDLICRPGDSYTVTGQIHNQGTKPLTGVTARLALPTGDRPAAGQSVQLTTAATSPGITAMAASSLDPTTSSLGLTFSGTLVPGGLIRVTATLVVGGTVGTAGCTRGSPAATCPTGEPQGAPLTFAVTHIDQAGDPDSFGPGCSVVDIRLCPTGIHDKQAEPDEVDPVGHNLDAALGVDSTYDLRSEVAVLSVAPAGGWTAGQSVVVRASAFNTGPAVAGNGWSVSILFPKGSAPVVPPKNALRTCARTTLAAGVIKVTCTGLGPLSPGVTSIAVDVSAKVPATAKAGSRWQVVAYVAPASAQSPETNPLGTPPTSPAVDATATPTNDDAVAAVAVS